MLIKNLITLMDFSASRRAPVKIYDMICTIIPILDSNADFILT